MGGFSAEIDGTTVPDDAWRHRRGADVVKILALAPAHRLHREAVMAALWPDLDTEAAQANLRKALHFARRALGSADAITIRNGLVELWPRATVQVDVEHFGPDEFAELLPEDRYAEWTEPRRTELTDLAIQMLRRARRWERILEIDRTDEESHRALMRRLLDAGDASAAVRQFQRLRAILRADLGVGPQPETVALFERALAARATAPDLSENVQTLIARGLVAWNRRDFAAAERLAEDARRLARDHHLGRELGEACALLGLTAFAQGRWRERFREDFETALRLAPGESAFVFDAHVCLAETAMGGVDAAALADDARGLAVLAERAGSTQGRALASLLVGEAELYAGRERESRLWLDSAVELFASAHADSGAVLAMLRVVESAIAQGDHETAEAVLARSRDLAATSELAPHLVTRAFATTIHAARSLEAKIEALAGAERSIRPDDVCGPCAIGLWVIAAIVAARAGELPRARRFLADAERLSGMWQGGPWRAATWEARAAVRLAEGHRDQAAGLLREAASLFAQCGRPSDERRCREEAARLVD